MKSWNDTPVFFVSLAHHFYNQLCGQAPSIPDEGAFFINQSEGLLSGITSKGWAVIRELLSLDDSNQIDISKGRRILVDLKHMNVVSRNDYYQQIITPLIGTVNQIPVIASHCCYSGIDTIAQLTNDMKNENNGSSVEKYGTAFYPWNINLCDEEIRLIFASGGIIGLNFDQGVLGISGKQKKDVNHFSHLFANIRAMVLSVLNASDEQLFGQPKQNTWNFIG